MKYLKSFNESLFSVRSEGIHKICKKYGIENYTINDDLSIDVNGDVNLTHIKLYKIPVNFRNVSGSFLVNGNFLTSLIGSPKYVGIDYSCKFNLIESLVGGPKIVKGTYHCYNIPTLTSLEGYPDEVGGNFTLNGNNLSSYDIQTNIGRYLDISSNNITNIPVTLNCLDVIFSYNPIELFLSAIQKDDIDATLGEIIYRLNEFEVIKDNNKIDLISLNSLYDFYDVEFDSDNFKNISGYEIY